MASIVIYPDDILRVKTESITTVDEMLASEVEDLKTALLTAQNGAGLAAVQIGLKRRFFGIKDSSGKEVDVFINPEVYEFFGQKTYLKLEGKDGQEQDFLEGCLSFPDLYGTVKRFFKIRGRWLTLKKGKLVKEEKILTGFEAVVFQHELDHLNGVLFIDHIKKDNGKLYRQVGEKMETVEGLNDQFQMTNVK